MHTFFRGTGVVAGVVCIGLMATPRLVAQGSAAGSVDADAAASARAGQAGAAAVQTTNISAELTDTMNSKKAKVGDAVSAKTLSAARISDGTTLPKGTKLMGHVTEVQARAGDQRDGHLSFIFDRAVLKDGQEVGIRATLRSITAPAMASAMANMDSDPTLSAGGGMSPGGVGAGGATSSGGRMGVGGLGRTAGSAGSTAGSAAGSTVGGVTNGIGSDVGDVGGTVRGGVQQGGMVDQTAGVRVGSGGSLMVPVANLPGVSASGSTSVSGVVSASGKNVELSSGTRMMFAVAAR